MNIKLPSQVILTSDEYLELLSNAEGGERKLEPIELQLEELADALWKDNKVCPAILVYKSDTQDFSLFPVQYQDIDAAIKWLQGLKDEKN